MTRFSRHLHELMPRRDDPLTEPKLEKVVRSIENLGLPSDRLVLVGSAALLAYGISLGYDRPHDADITVPADLFATLNETIHTPSGHELERKHDASSYWQKIIMAPESLDESTMPVDIITRYQPHGSLSINEHSANFQDYYREHSHIIPSTTLAVASLEHIYHELNERTRMYDPKAKDDFADVKASLNRRR